MQGHDADTRARGTIARVCALAAGLLLVAIPPVLGQGGWLATSTAGAPAPRYWHTAVWTGSSLIVWGGMDNCMCGVYLATGGVFDYDPSTDTWAPAPHRRRALASGRCLRPGVDRYPDDRLGRLEQPDGAAGHRRTLRRGPVLLVVDDDGPGARRAGVAQHGLDRVSSDRVIVWGGTNANRWCLDTGGAYAP